MEVSESQLTELYEQKDTDELLDLYRDGELTELAIGVLVSVLDRRGINFEEQKKQIDAEKHKNEKEEKPKATINIINSSTTGLYVISVLQILTSLAFQFYAGILFGVILAILAFVIRSSKVFGAALGVVILGVIAAITNFIGPIVGGVASGNFILSLITIWLGFRLIKACKIWVVLDVTHNKTNSADR